MFLGHELPGPARQLAEHRERTRRHLEDPGIARQASVRFVEPESTEANHQGLGLMHATQGIGKTGM